MNASNLFKKLYTKKHIVEHYNSVVYKKPSVGLDRISPKRFKKEIKENAEIISRKVLNGTYNITRYKQLLLLKGPDKLPRKINIPTVRDKLTLSILNELLVIIYGDDCKTKMPHLIIENIANSLDKYSHYIKVDISSFYGSINHSILEQKLKSKIRKKEIKTLIHKSITTGTLPKSIAADLPQNNKGIPEGIPISNSLANIYMIELDKKYEKDERVSYYRYVDDILILANADDYEDVYNEIKEDINALDLKINDKSEKGTIKKSFDYLGYSISDKKVSVRKTSIISIEQSIEELFKSVKNNDDLLAWKLNLKITGFIIDNHKYGWLFFYSQMKDISLLYHLDNVVYKLIKRYNLEERIKPKRFVRTYNEIIYRLHSTSYIPNMDEMDYDHKKEILRKIYNYDLSEKDDNQIEYLFRRIIRKEIRNIEKDIQNFS